MTPTLSRLTRRLAGAACLSGLCVGPTHAALIDRGGGLIYDTVLHITWLADMNYARTQFESAGGLVGTATGKMEWLQANTWANNLAYGGYIDWRLPNTVQPDPSCSLQNDEGASSGTGCTASEMGHLFYQDLGGHPGESVLDSTGDTALEMANLALFSNVQSNLYWSSTPYDPDSDFGWSFWTTNGNQSALNKDFQLFAMAVRHGDSVGTVPEPSAAVLALTAIGLISVGCRRRRPAVR